MSESLSLVRGTLDLLVLKALTWSPMHGFEITAWIEEHSGGELEIADSALYQALYRTEERGLATASWGLTANNRRARYYHITRAGRSHLAAESSQFERYAERVLAMLRAAPRPT